MADPSGDLHSDADAPAQDTLEHQASSTMSSPPLGRTRSASNPVSPTSTSPDARHSYSPSEDSLMTPRPEPYQAASHGAGLVASLDDGYFHPNAKNSHSVDPLTIRQNTRAAPLLPRLSTVSVNAESSTTDRQLASAKSLEFAQDSPMRATDDTITSATTVSSEASGSVGTRAVPQRSMTEYPTYPDQSFIALQSQVHPKPRQPPFSSRPRSSMYAGGSSALPVYPARLAVQEERGSRTAGNSPAHTPGLYTPRSARQPYITEMDLAQDQSPYPSPYLHPVQPHPPKETHKAEKDVDLFSGRKKINQYEILKELGRGVHGKVKLARSLETDEYVAIKIVQRYPKKPRLGKAPAPEDKVKREVAILKKASHRNVVSMLEVIDDPFLAKIYIVLEFCELREVSWRAIGDSAIVYVEEKRLARVAAGLSPTPASKEEQRMIKSANRRERRRRTRWRQRRRDDGSTEFWSLEFAEESGTSGDESEAISRTSSAPNDKLGSTSNLADLPEEEVLTLSSEQHDDDAITPVPGQHIPPPTTQPSLEGWDYLDGHSQAYGQPLPTGELADSLDEVMTNISLGRKTSVSESISSQITEAMEEEVTEEHRYVPVMTIQESRAAFRDAVLGLEYLHYQGIVHRDIKPANLLRTKDHRVKISDFGVSYLGKPMRDGKESEEASDAEVQDLDEETELAKTVGTPAFYAPELCSLDITSETVVTGLIDVWALGVTLYCLLFARTPFTADNTFALMKSIAEDEVFIPRMRLKAIEPRSSSEYTTHGPIPRTTNQDKRQPNELVYEDIDDDLHDLLKRLLIKNPSDRISIKEVKHHPWVVADISNKSAWLEDTDPSRHTQGKRIEISNEEVAEAVVPIKVVDRVKSVMKRAAGAIGLGARKDHSASSDQSSPSSQSPDGRRASIRPDESIFSALKASRERDGETPAASTITTTPDGIPPDQQFFHDNHSAQPIAEGSPDSRPGMPPRMKSDMSTAASIKTIKQQDFDRGRGSDASSSRTPAPIPESAPGSATLGGLLNGAGQRILRSMRSRDRGSRTPDALSSSPARSLGDASEDVHADPSVVVSMPHVAGVLGRGIEASPVSSVRDSPTSSPVSSTNASSDRLYPPATSAARKLHHTIPESFGGGMSKDAAPYSPRDDPPSEEEVFRAREMMQRRRAMEDEKSNPTSAEASRPTSSGACPPSPDDDLYNEKQLKAETAAKTVSPTSSGNSAPAGATSDLRAVSSSSEDRFASGASQSTFPSMASMLSADTSVLPEQGSSDQLKDDSANSSDTANPGSRVSPAPLQPESENHLTTIPTNSSSGFLRGSEDEGYVGDTAAEPDEDVADSDSDGDDFLVMSRKKNGSGTSKTSTGSDSGWRTTPRRSPRNASSHSSAHRRSDEAQRSA